MSPETLDFYSEVMEVSSEVRPEAVAVTVIRPGRSETLIKAVAIPASASTVVGLARVAWPETEKVTSSDASGTTVLAESTTEA